MAGKGAVPKSPERLAGNGAAKARASQMKIVESAPVPQPALPEFMPSGDPWPVRTLDWWEMWSDDPLSAEFRATDWAELMDTALIHAEVWSGNTKMAGELRLRTQMFGTTAESRARLRIQYAAADEADEKRRSSKAGADVRGRYKGLKAVDNA